MKRTDHHCVQASTTRAEGPLPQLKQSDLGSKRLEVKDECLSPWQSHDQQNTEPCTATMAKTKKSDFEVTLFSSHIRSTATKINIKISDHSILFVDI
jgi:hypothetical protein